MFDVSRYQVTYLPARKSAMGHFQSEEASTPQEAQSHHQESPPLNEETHQRFLRFAHYRV